MTEPAADTTAVLTGQDSLVLASMASPVERDLVTAWMAQQRADRPEARFDVLELPPPNAPAGALAALIEQLEAANDANDDRAVVPVRVFWLPPPNRGRIAKLAGLLPGRDPYHPNERQQLQIMRNAPQRARVVAGEPAKVSELRQQWRETTVGENSCDFARFVIRRALLALERVEYRILGRTNLRGW